MASSSCAATPSSVLTDRDRVIGELTLGRKITDELLLKLRDTGVDDGASAQDLVERILETFTQSISVLCAGGESDEVSQVPAAGKSTGLKSEDSGDSCKTPAPKDRRGCYKRKKTSETRIEETPASVDDGYAWRKYGQKSILNARYPRNYFRCTHKFDRGCQASKQVQQINEDPPIYRTTYHGRHTCTNLFKPPHQIIIDAPTQDSSIIWNFQSRQPAGFKPEIGFGDKAAIKQESEDDYRVRPSPSGGPNYCIPAELAAFDGSNDHFGAFSTGSDHGDVVSPDVYSCTTSTRGVDMDMMAGSVDLDDFLMFGSLN